MKKLLIFIILISSLSCVTKNDSVLKKVPFEFINNHIYLEATLNNNKHYFIFDTGADMCLVDTLIAKDKTPSGDIELDLNGIVIDYYYTDFTLGKYRVNNVLTGIYDLTKLNEAAVNNFTGIIGRSFLSNFTFGIDYKNNEILLAPAVDAIISEIDSNDFKELKLYNDKSQIYIEVVANSRTYPAQIDTGAEYSYIPKKLLDEIRNNNPELVKDTFIVEELTDVFIGNLRNKSNSEAYVLLSELQMGEMVFNDLFLKAWDQKHFLLGNDFLKYFTWILDYYNRIILVKPEFDYKNISSLDLSKLLDVNFYCYPDGKLVVKEIVVGSKQWETGLRPNMVVSSINGYSTVESGNRDDIRRIVDDNIYNLHSVEVVDEVGNYQLYQF